MRGYLIFVLLTGSISAQSVSLPQTWVNSLEYLNSTTYTVNFPTYWSCGPTRYPAAGDYANTQAGLDQALADAETCRTATNNGTYIRAAHGAVYSGTAGVTFRQTAGDISTHFIILDSDTPLPIGRTVCSHGIQDNLAVSTQPGIRNPGCNGSAMSYQLGKSITSVSGAFMLANGTATNTSAYNDVASMYTIELSGGAANNAISTASADANGVAPHHFAILNVELRPEAGQTSVLSVAKIGQGGETLNTCTAPQIAAGCTPLSQIPHDIHIAYFYGHGDMLDAPMTGCPDACVATGPVTGSNQLPNVINLNSCIYCSLSYGYTEKALRPGGEGHTWVCILCQSTKAVHDWFEGQSIGFLSMGASATYSIDQFQLQDLEDRGNRYTYPYSWILSADAQYYWNSIMNTTGGTGTGAQLALRSSTLMTVYTPGSGYTPGDILTPIYGTHSNARVTVDSVDGGGGLTGVTLTTPGSGYSVNSWVRKNPYEYKGCLRCLSDGDIFENSDSTGGQGGQMIFHHTSNVSQNTGDNYWIQVNDLTITNNILRNGCTGLSLGARSALTSGEGGGQTEPTQRYLYANNLLYNVSLSNPRCAGTTNAYGLRVGGGANTWPATATLDATGTIVTATLTPAAGQLQSRVHVGDPIQMSGCVSTSASSFNTTPTVMGPLAITGTVTAGLTIVYPAMTPGIPNDTATGCTYNNVQGYLGNLTATHNTHILDQADVPRDPRNPVSGGSTPYEMQRSLTWQNNITLGGGGILATGWEGTRATNSAWDPTTLIYNNNILADRDSAVTCPIIHPSPGPGGAACYTEYAGSHAGASPPVTLYLTPTATCSGNDPTVGDCVGVIGAMSTGTTPLALPDWHHYRLCKATDAACNNKASLYAAGGTRQATDGLDLGADLSKIDAAQVSTQYSAAGAFPDVPGNGTQPNPPTSVNAVIAMLEGLL